MNILCPIDFTPHSMHAAKISVALAQKLNSDLSVLNIVGSEGLKENYQERLEENKKKLNEWVAGVSWSSDGKILPHCYVNPGSVIESLQDFTKKHSIDLLVIGTEGLESFSNFVFGSTAEKVMKKLSIPILAIPNNAEINLEGHPIVIGVDKKEIDDALDLTVLLQLGKVLDSTMDIIHVDSKPEEVPFDPWLLNKLGDHAGEYVFIQSTDVDGAIKDWAEKNGRPIIVMIKRKHTFFEKLLFKSHTQTEMLTSNVPILVMPEK